MKINKWTPEEIAGVVQHFKKYHHHKTLANHSIGSIYSQFFAFNKWEKGDKKIPEKTKMIFEKVKEFLEGAENGQLKNSPVVTQTAPVLSKEEYLQKAWMIFQKSLVEYIEYETNKLSDEKTKEVKKQYESKLLQMQAILVETKQESLIGMLNKRFGGLQ